MNSVVVALVSLVLFAAGYRYYEAKMKSVWKISKDNVTPAHEKYNGVDFVPARNWFFLFGHHFSSIAGAGPILGPVIACAIWGWLPALVWVVLGSVFIGGPHDFSALMISVRNGGASIADVSEELLGRTARFFFSVFIFLALILVIAVFAIVTAKTLIATPQIVIPTFGLIFVAVLTGVMLYRWKMNAAAATVIGLALMALLVAAGQKYPLGLNCAEPLRVWILVLLVYAGTASVLPVNILLQPRDYLSSYFLFAGLLMGYAGIFISHPVINAPAVVLFGTDKGFVWPTLCIIVACGAISGFHSLVASGTTSKQISDERDAFKIGYGTMILEGILAVLAIIAVTAGLGWTGAGSYPAMVSGGDWIGTFAAGFGNISRPVAGKWGFVFAMIMLNAFVMTTLDSATRITRYIGQELFGGFLKIRILKNSFAVTALILVAVWWFSTGPQARIWPLFGASNQLIAALGLLVAAAYLFAKKKPAAHIVVPGVFMLVTTIAALVFEMIRNFGENTFLFTLAFFLLAMAFFMIIAAAKQILKERAKSSGGRQ
ncbi:MAG: carbon starvation CstA family protein [Elusimicrobiota bacterium]|nr:carbon starvation CstA family protein [Elusimicrobiota bacterium]